MKYTPSQEACVRAKRTAWTRVFAAAFIVLAAGCQARVKLVVSDISEDARVIDLAIWRHAVGSDGITRVFYPSKPTSAFLFKNKPDRYRIMVELDHNTEYSVFVASFVPQNGSPSSVCLQDISNRTILNPLGLLEPIVDISVQLHKLREDNNYPSSSCLTSPNNQGEWPTRIPLISQFSLALNTQISDSSSSMAMADMGLMPDGGTMGGPPSDMGGGNRDGGAGGAGGGNGDMPPPPPGKLTIEGWFFDPTTTLSISKQNCTEDCTPVPAVTPPTIDAGRMQLPLESGTIGKLRGSFLDVTVTSQSGQSNTASTTL